MPPNAPVLSYESEETNGYRNTPIFFVNGEAVSLQCARQARPNQTVLTFLREILHLTGSKLGCAEGGCGACTVMVSKYNSSNHQWRHISVNACLMPILAADGCHITTVEGVGNIQNLHPVQKLMVDLHGSQCGFCTPGIIVSLYTLFTNGMSPQEHLDGNLCRCTGYRPIHDAAALAHSIIGPCGTPCNECPNQDHCELHDELVVSTSDDKKKSLQTMDFGDSWKDQATKMMPPALELQHTKSPLRVEVNQACWISPNTFESLLKVLRDEGPCKIVVGNTEVGIETRFKHADYPKLVYPDESIQELYQMEVSDTEIVIGACCSLSTIQEQCEKTKSGPVKSLSPIHDMLRWFASTQIRNVACLGGNLVTASPISDMNPVLAALGAELVLASLGEDDTIIRRTVPVAEFFMKYRTVDLKSCEMVECIRVPTLSEMEFFAPFKQARRREDDISIVTSGQRIKVAKEADGSYTITDAALAYGGLAPTTVMAKEAVNDLIGAKFCLQSFQNASKRLLTEMNLPETVPGGQAAYRMTLATSFLRKMFLTVAKALTESDDCEASNFGVDPSELISLTNFLDEEKPSYRGTQSYPKPQVAQGLEEKILPNTSSKEEGAAAVGKAVPHASGALHCTGEAVYTDDIQLPQGTLQSALVLSSDCGSIFKSMDIAPAMNIDGVLGVYSYEDILKLGGSNELGPIVHDEVVFLPPGEKIRTVGQVLGIVVAESLELAELGARLVVVDYQTNEEKIVVSIDDAIAAGSYYEFSRHSLRRGDQSVLSQLETAHLERETQPRNGDVITVAGSFHSGAQEHFYLETNSSLVVPSDAGTNLTIFSSTQAPTKTQNFCASATGLQQARVAVKVKRMGGGFGGKETRSVFATVAAAVAAKRLNRPVRLTLARDVDMKLTGTRHAFKSTYKASAEITNDGVRLLACDVKLFANGGNAFDLSGPVVDRALFHADGCYYYPHFQAEGVVCKTVQPPHTAFRGFGGPQGMAVAEHIIDHLAVACKVSPDKIRRENMYKVGDHVPFGMVIGESDSGKWNVGSMWDKMYKELDVANVRKENALFNAEHKWTKRGFSMTPTKFGIAFTSKFMNQGGALVHVYTDGTVLVSHGGTEMGQGLHTKVCQVAAQAFNIPISNVFIDDSSTDKVANTIPTAASMSTDLYGMATLDACRQILKRLAPIREQLGPDAPLSKVASTAHFDRIDLSAHGFFTVDGSRCGFDWNKEKPADYPDSLPENSWKGHPFNYFTQGVACTLVEIDVLSGNHKTLRADVLVDVGSSINPSIDIGQIEGAFIQGMGWSTIEEVIYACDDHTWIRPRGAVFTTGPGTYKIPAFNDVPEEFNVTLLDKVDNPFAVHSSKAVGEPPFFLGAAVFYAIKDAVMAARNDNSYFEMRMPATSERIRMYSTDELSAAAVKQVYPDSTPSIFQPQGTF